jgi:CSLREA domain-containing protein
MAAARMLIVLVGMLFAAPAGAAVFTVTKTTDTADGACDADCSLREAIVAANGAPGSTVVVPAGAYRLSIPRGARGANALGTGTDGNLVVSVAMTIAGAGSDATIVDARPTEGADGVDRVFGVTLTGNLAMSGLTLQGGKTLEFGQGGGMLVLGGTASLTRVRVTGNVGTSGGGGLTVSGGGLPGNLTLTRCTIDTNTTGAMGQGGGLLNLASNLTVYDSTIADNVATRSTGGGIANIDVAARPNPPAVLRVIRSTIAGNVAGDPSRTSLNEGVGGGISNSGGRLMLTNSTVTGNEAIPSFAEGFGELPGTGRGGGVYHQLLLGDDPNDGTTIVNSTIAYNVALTGSQLYGDEEVHPLRVANTLVARDASATGNCASPGGETGIESFGGNLSSDASPCFFTDPTDQSNTDPGLDTGLADNGGPTDTIALLENSNAIGATFALSCPTIDQRGSPRRNPCDVGAVEAVPEATITASLLTALATITALRRRSRAS